MRRPEDHSMSATRKTLAWLNNAETLVCEVLLALFVTLLFVQIMARQLFEHNIAWSEELSTYMFVWFAYLRAVVAAKMSAHNRVTVRMQFLPKWLSKTMLTVADLLWVAFNVYFVYLSYDFVFNRMNLFWKAQTLGVPMKFVYLILPIAFSLMTLRILWNLYLRVFKDIEPLDPEAQELENFKKNADQAST